MDRKSEIKVLQSLKGDTYFAQYFTSADIDQMCENISNDFAIEMGCPFNQKAEALQRQLTQTKKEAEDARIEFAQFLIKTEGTAMSNDVYQRIESEFGLNFIIKTKWNNGISLEDYEIEYMVSNLK